GKSTVIRPGRAMARHGEAATVEQSDSSRRASVSQRGIIAIRTSPQRAATQNQISVLLPDSAENFSTIWCFSIKGTAPAGRVEEFRLENRLSLPWFQSFNALTYAMRSLPLQLQTCSFVLPGWPRFPSLQHKQPHRN